MVKAIHPNNIKADILLSKGMGLHLLNTGLKHQVMELLRQAMDHLLLDTVGHTRLLLTSNTSNLLRAATMNRASNITPPTGRARLRLVPVLMLMLIVDTQDRVRQGRKDQEEREVLEQQ